MTATDMEEPAENSQRLWRTSTFAGGPSFVVAPPPACIASLRALSMSRPTTETANSRHPAEKSLRCGPFIRDTLNKLENGVGFTVIDLESCQQESIEDKRNIFFAFGTMLGKPMPQDARGTLIYDVIDKGLDVTKGARFSVTNLASSFHNDNSYGHIVPDYVGLFCIGAAMAGGESQLVSGYTIAHVLRTAYPELYDALQSEYHFDRRGEFAPGDEAVSRHPIILWNRDDLLFRFLRYYIEMGHDIVGEPLTGIRRNAIDVLESLLESPEYRVVMRLQPSELLLTNNRWVLHNRTAFVDDVSPNGTRRHLLRLWVRSATRGSSTLGTR
jgi:hypothetical protein